MTDDNGVTYGSLGDELPPEPTPERRTLTGFLGTITAPRRPDEAAGGVPVPAEWHCFRAVLGGATRKDLERAHAPQEMGRAEDELKIADARVNAAKQEGTHLPAGLHIFTGQTGGGKSALAANLARTAAKAGHPVLYVTLELDGEEIAARILSLESGVPWFKLALRKPLVGDERVKSQLANAALTNTEDNAAERIAVLAPLGPFNVDTLHREAFELWRTHKRVPLVVFDYLQLAAVRTSSDYRAPLREAIAAVVLELRTLSRRRADEPEWPGCPVVVLSTTARASVKGENKVQGMDGKDPDALRFEDLETLKALPKEAGEVEATAVTAWVVALGDADTNGTRPLTMRLAKNRLGLPGQWVPFRFHGATGRLEEEPTRYTTVTNGGGVATPVDAALKGKKGK